MQIARSSLVCPSSTSFKYIKTVTNGACPFVVIREMTWYWIICTPCLISSRTLFSAISLILISSNSKSSAANSSRTIMRYFSLLTCTNGARCDREMLCPPYCALAICAMLWVAILHAVAKLFGGSISVSLITVPFCSISSRLTRQQLCICCAK